MDLIRPSERYLIALNRAADTDITLLVQAGSRARRDEVLRRLREVARAEPFHALALRGRGLEPRWRRALHLDTFTHEDEGGEPTLLQALGERELLLRWSHLAGDAWSLRALVGAALGERPARGSACSCAQPTDLPRVLGELWEPERGSGPWRERLRAAGVGLAPLAPSRERAGPRPRPVGTERVVGLAAPEGPHLFAASLACLRDLLQRSGTLGTDRFVVMVDLRRHAELRVRGLGNLSAPLFLSTQGDPEALRERLRLQLAARSWAPQLAVDRALTRAPRLAGALAHATVRLSPRWTPVAVTDLWDLRASTCRQCGGQVGALPEDLAWRVLPPALPTGGLTVGLTRRAAGGVLTLRADAGVLDRLDLDREPVLWQSALRVR